MTQSSCNLLPGFLMASNDVLGSYPNASCCCWLPADRIKSAYKLISKQYKKQVRTQLHLLKRGKTGSSCRFNLAYLYKASVRISSGSGKLNIYNWSRFWRFCESYI